MSQKDGVLHAIDISYNVRMRNFQEITYPDLFRGSGGIFRISRFGFKWYLRFASNIIGFELVYPWSFI